MYTDMTKHKKKVLVALSGGVDSSVSAALLREEGHEVHGAFIQSWSPPWLPCTWREERRDAMRVAAHLKIPFHTIDLSREYEAQVVTYMVGEYAQGRTPNPDVMCNIHIKFGGFFDWAMRQGFDQIATGHYARVVESDGLHTLLSGVDERKDQTYFLWALTHEHLLRTRFPIGHLKKEDVRALAETFSLPTASKKDSQGICFLGDINMKEFLEHYIPNRAGDVLTPEGERIGTHDGSMYYTLGQRHGFTIYKKTPQTPPLYVVAKDIEKNTITVAPKPVASALGRTVAVLSHVVLRENADVPSFSCSARIRYRQPLFPVEVKNERGVYKVHFPNPEPFVSSGQSIVFYRTDMCLGGGVLE